MSSTLTLPVAATSLGLARPSSRVGFWTQLAEHCDFVELVNIAIWYELVYWLAIWRTKSSTGIIR